MKYVRKSERMLRHRQRVRLEEPAYDFVDTLKNDLPLKISKFDLEHTRQEIKIVEGALKLLVDENYIKLKFQLSNVVESIRNIRVAVAHIVLKGVTGHGEPEDDNRIFDLRKKEQIFIQTALHIEIKIIKICKHYETLSEPFLMVRQNFGMQPGALKGGE